MFARPAGSPPIKPGDITKDISWIGNYRLSLCKNIFDAFSTSCKVLLNTVFCVVFGVLSSAYAVWLKSPLGDWWYTSFPIFFSWDTSGGVVELWICVTFEPDIGSKVIF